MTRFHSCKELHKGDVFGQCVDENYQETESITSLRLVTKIHSDTVSTISIACQHRIMDGVNRFIGERTDGQIWINEGHRRMVPSYIIPHKDLALFTHLKYKSEKFFDLLAEGEIRHRAQTKARAR